MAQRKVIGAALVTLAVSASIAAIITAGRGDGFSMSFAISLAYCLLIGVPSMLIFPRLRLGNSALRQWLVYVALVVAFTVIATFTIRGTLVAIGVIDLEGMWAGMRVSLVISAAVGIPATVGAVTYGRLRTRVGDAESRATDARLASLESRVRPHFLFNALNSAIALIPEDPKRAESVLESLAALLRFSLDAQTRVVTLREELRIATDYLEIERARFGERLRYELDVPAELAAHEVPAFAIQTLVENSVKYAVSPRMEGATIWVAARVEGKRLAISVRDDGPGFTGTPWLPGHGLDSLRARLLALYGDRARLSPVGSVVTIEVPL
jgi:LytS/YehU family sensor histidine kinase